jgi:uncharacterized membrane protein
VRLGPPALALLVVVAALTGCGGGSDEDGNGSGGSAEPATFAEVQQIVEQRCVPCHSPDPTVEGYEQAGLIDFSVEQNIEANRELINTVVVVQKRMPFNNETNMTQEERDRIASWAEAATS